MNVLLVFCDQMRWDCLGAAGNPVIQTPNLDRLAAEGVRFTNAWCTSPLCTPARAQILTGRPCWDSGVWGLADRVPPSMRTFAHELGDLGVFTGAVGKMHFRPTNGAGSMREPHGFDTLILSEEIPPDEDLHEDDYWQYLEAHGYGEVGKYKHGRRSPDYGVEGYHAQISPLPLEHFDTVWTADETIRLLEARAGGPFCIWCSFVKPHFPCELPADWPCPYDPADIPLRPTTTAEPDMDGEPFSFNAATMRNAVDAGWLEEDTLRQFAAYYYGNVTLIDMQVGRLLLALERLGLRDDTLILFTSDHGEQLGERGMVGKFNYYDESCRVPFLAAGPMIPDPGRVDDRPVILEDLPSTIVDAAGGSVPDYMTGASLLPLLRNDDAPWRDQVHGVMGGAYHFEPQSAHCFIRRDRWKYMYQFAGGSERLFDVVADPLETVNLAAAEPSVCTHLNGRLADWFATNGATFLVQHSTRRLRRC